MSDDELRVRLQAADPAGGLDAADGEHVTQLLAGAMAEEATESRLAGTRGRSGFTWLVAAVAVLVIGSVASYVVVRELEPAAPVASEEPSGGGTLELALPDDAAAGRCMLPTPALLRDADMAVDATAAEVSGGQVRLRPSRVFAGGPVDEVVVAQATPDRLALLLGVRFEEGGRYLVAADGGTVLGCGFSGTWTPRRERLYEKAFGAE